MNRRSFLCWSGALLTLIACSVDSAATDEDDLETRSEFDFVIVGSGAGGGPLAANLALRGFTVLLLEAGKDRGDSLNYQVPAFHGKSSEDATMRWDYFVKHYDEGREPAGRDSKYVASGSQKGILYPRAGTLGGCTSHNAMITVKPTAHDWNEIAERTGDATWRAEAMDVYWKRLERCTYMEPSLFGDDRGHGYKGWLETRRADPELAFEDRTLLEVIRSAAAGFALSTGGSLNAIERLSELVGVLKRDLNAPGSARDQAEGLFMIPMAIQGVKRIGPREFIRDVQRRAPNRLAVRTDCLVSKVLFEDASGNAVAEDGKPRATGVEYMKGEHLYAADPGSNAGVVQATVRVFAKHEVVLSAGAFNTPQLLKLSGIGPKEELAQHSIPVVADLPAVGTNLQDRYEVGIVSDIGRDLPTTKACTFGQLPDPCLEDWKDGKGAYATNGGIVGVVKKSTPDKPEPDLFVFAVPGNFRGYVPGYAATAARDKNMFTWAVLKAHTKNTMGRVTLRSADPRDVPEINFAYFQNPEADEDLKAVVEGVKFARAIGRESVSRVGKFTELWPGPNVSSDVQIGDFVKREAWGHHASCTVPMGAKDDSRAALNSALQVRHVSRLRLVDASVFPKIPGFFIVTAIYMVSEKAADLLESAAHERG